MASAAAPGGVRVTRVAAPAAGATGALLSAVDLRYAYGYHRVLDGVSLQLGAGEILAIFGPNGAGKSTLLRLLAGLLRPQAGEVRWWGTPVEELGPAVRGRCAWIGHRSHLFPALTARENLEYYARLLGLPAPARCAAEALAAEGLSLYADRPVATLSHGMVQRLSLCRAWLASPLLVFADEPATGLDPQAAARLAGALAAVRSRGGGAILVAHDHAQALELADRYLILHGGGWVDGGRTALWRGAAEAFAEHYRAAVTPRRVRRPGAPGIGNGAGTAPCAGGRPLPHPAPAAGPTAVRALAAVCRRELTLWLRAQERLPSVLATGLLVAVTFGFAFDPLAVGLQHLIAGILWLSLLLIGLPAFGRAFLEEWETDALEAYLACGASPAALFYGKCLANLLSFLLAEGVLLPAFLVLLEVRPGPGLPGALLTLLVGSLGFVAAGTLLAAVVGRAGGGEGQGLLPLVALPLLAPAVFGTARLAQGFLDGAPLMAGAWLLLLSAYALLFWALPAVLFPVVVAV